MVARLEEIPRIHLYVLCGLLIVSVISETLRGAGAGEDEGEVEGVNAHAHTTF